MSKIFAAMAAILADFPAVGKENKNPSQGYNYRGVDDALEAAHPLFAKHGVFLAIADTKAEFMDAGETKAGKAQVRCVYTANVKFTHVDGSSVEAGMVGEAIDTGDKALMKAQANAMKYLLWYTFVVPTRETLDSEAYSDPDGGSSAGGKKAKKTPAKKTQPEDGEDDEGPLDGAKYNFQPGIDFQAACTILDNAAKEKRLAETHDSVKEWCLARPAGDKERKGLVTAYRFHKDKGDQPGA